MLEDIRNNIEKLIALYEAEKAENGTLRAQLQQSRDENETYRKQIAGLGKEIDTLKLTEAFTAQGTGRSSDAKEMIDKMIREIDRCISLLEH